MAASPKQKKTITEPPPTDLAPWQLIFAAIAALITVFVVYSPASSAPFLLDDLYQPYGRPNIEALTWNAWTAQRPLLGVTYWLNWKTSGIETSDYHTVNVLLHWAVGCVVFLLTKSLLQRVGEAAPRRSWLALTVAGVFLLHPLQSESVAYIASRSELLSSLFAYSSAVLFLCRPMGWIRAVAVMALIGCGVLSKEHIAVFPGVLILADLLLPSGELSVTERLKSNWKLYALCAVGSIAGVRYILRVITVGTTVGLNINGVSWLDYFYTQCRVIWQYLRLFILPTGLNIDPDVAISRSITDHGAIFGLLGIATLIVGAFLLRRTYALAAFGLLSAFVLLAPTSSFLVIADPMAERRMYLPMLGFLLVLIDLARRWKPLQGNTLIAVSCALFIACGALTFGRAQVWSSPESLWKDAVVGSPNKQRPHYQLAFAYKQQERCEEAAEEFDRASKTGPPEFTMMMNWGQSLHCAGKLNQAIEVLYKAVSMETNAGAYAEIAMIHAEQNKLEDALRVLDQSEQVDRTFGVANLYRGNIYLMQNQPEKAAEQFKIALKKDPSDAAAAESLKRLGK